MSHILRGPSGFKTATIVPKSVRNLIAGLALRTGKAGRAWCAFMILSSKQSKPWQNMRIGTALVITADHYKGTGEQIIRKMRAVPNKVLIIRVI
jgi:hypothetical protein